jgi:hypothetical protein
LFFKKHGIRSASYTTLKQFTDDIRLMVANALRYNAFNSVPYKAAIDLKIGAFSYLERLLPAFPAAFVGNRPASELTGTAIISIKLGVGSSSAGAGAGAGSFAASTPAASAVASTPARTAAALPTGSSVRFQSPLIVTGPRAIATAGVASQFVVRAGDLAVRDAVHSVPLVDSFVLASYDPYRFADIEEPSMDPPPRNVSTLRKALDNVPADTRAEALRTLAALRTGHTPPSKPFVQGAAALVQRALAPTALSPDDLRLLAEAGVDVSAIEQVLASKIDAKVSNAVRRACNGIVQLHLARLAEPDASNWSDALLALMNAVERDVALAVERVGEALPVRIDNSLKSAVAAMLDTR